MLVEEWFQKGCLFTDLRDGPSPVSEWLFAVKSRFHWDTLKFILTELRRQGRPERKEIQDCAITSVIRELQV